MAQLGRHGKAVLWCLGISGAAALRAQSFTVEQALSAPFMEQLTKAASGSGVAWVENDKGASNVWIADGPKFEPHRVTHYEGDSGQEITSLRLTPDGKAVVFALGSESNGGGRAANPATEVKQPTQQVWSANVADGKPHPLGELGCGDEDCEDIEISPNGRYAVWAARHHLWIAPVAGGKASQLTDLRGDAGSPRWSPDGKHLAFVVDRGDHAFLAVTAIEDDRLAGIGYASPSVDRDAMPRWSPDGSRIAFIRQPGGRNKQPLIPVMPQPWAIWVADTATLTAAPVWQSGTAARDSLPLFIDRSFQFAADNRIVFDSEQDGRNHLYSLDATAGKNADLLTPGDFDVEDVALSADKRSVLFSSNQNDADRRHLWRVGAAGGAQPVALTSGETLEWTPIETSDGKSVLCIGSTATTPSMVYRITPAGRELVTKDALPRDFPSSAFVTPKQVVFQSADGYTLHGQFFSPKPPSKPGAAVLFFHGGPMRQMMLGFHYMSYYSNAYAENEYLASLGFTVLSVNYRLGIMYGRDFREAPNSSWRGAAEYNDVLAAATYLRSLPEVSPSRIGVWGGSYGGYLTALALARNSNIFAAGVDYHGVHDWTTQGDIPADAASAPDYKDALRLAWDSSPDASIETWRSPVLLIQGDDDRNVPFNQTVDLVQRLRAQRVPFEQMVYPDEIHDFLLHRSWVRSYKATAEFLQKYLQKKD